MEPFFGLCWDGALASRLREAGARLRVIRPASFARPWTVFRSRADLREALLAEKPDLVVCHEFWNYALAAPVVRKIRLPLVVWHHSPPRGYWLELFVRFYKPDLAIACSRYVALKLRSLEKEDRIRYCYAPIPAPESPRSDARERVRRDVGVRADEVVVCFVGRLSAYKGQRQLLDAVALLKDLPLRTWITAPVQSREDSEFLASLKAQCKASGIEHSVRFFEHFESAQDLYVGADIYCQPNASPEPFGFTFVEALYAGLPVVSTEIGGALEILRGDASDGGTQDFGVLVPPQDVESLAHALRVLICDASQRERFRAKGAKRALEISNPAVVMPKLASLLNEAIQYHRGATL